MLVDPLQDLADIQAVALDDPDTNQMVQFITQIYRQLSALNIRQSVTKKQIPLLLIIVRQSRVDETVWNMFFVVHVVEPVVAPA